MIYKRLNGTKVGSGTGISFTGVGITASDNGSDTTFDFSPVIQVATVQITNTQLKALRATPVTLVAAPGAGKVLEFISAVIKNNGGTNALTESTANMAVKYTDGSGAAVSQAIESTGFVDQTAATVTAGLPKIDPIVAYASAANKALVLHNTGAGEFGGNAANDVTFSVKVAYRVHSL